MFSVLLDKFAHPSDLGSTKPATGMKPDRVKPKFRYLVVTLNMNMHRLIPIASIEEESV